MRTTLNLDEDLLKELMAVTEAKTKVQAIHVAISEFLRRKKLQQLLSLAGKLKLDLDWRELEEQELKAQKDREGLLRGHR